MTTWCLCTEMMRKLCCCAREEIQHNIRTSTRTLGLSLLTTCKRSIRGSYLKLSLVVKGPEATRRVNPGGGGGKHVTRLRDL